MPSFEACTFPRRVRFVWGAIHWNEKNQSKLLHLPTFISEKNQSPFDLQTDRQTNNKANTYCDCAGQGIKFRQKWEERGE